MNGEEKSENPSNWQKEMQVFKCLLSGKQAIRSVCFLGNLKEMMEQKMKMLKNLYTCRYTHYHFNHLHLSPSSFSDSWNV